MSRARLGVDRSPPIESKVRCVTVHGRVWEGTRAEVLVGHIGWAALGEHLGFAVRGSSVYGSGLRLGVRSRMRLRTGFTTMRRRGGLDCLPRQPAMPHRSAAGPLCHLWAQGVIRDRSAPGQPVL